MKTFYCIAIFCFFFSCQSKTNTEGKNQTVVESISAIFSSSEKSSATAYPGDYIAFIDNEVNGLRVKKEVEDIEFKLQYKPLDYVTLSEIKSRNFSAKEFERKRKEFEGLQYYTLRIQSNRTDNLLKFDGSSDGGDKLDYLAFRMQGDLSLVDGKDTLPCVLHHYERTYNITPHSDFLIAFEIPGKGKGEVNDKILIFEDRLFNLGTIKLKIRKEDLQNIPTLIYNKNESES